MSCEIDLFEMTEKQILNWCKLGCSVDCYKLLKEKYKLKESAELMEKVREELQTCSSCEKKGCMMVGGYSKTCGYKLFEEVEAELKAAEEALEKQVNKKVKIKEMRFQQVGIIHNYFCETCEKEIYPQRKEECSYCQHCGQKLDWSV